MSRFQITQSEYEAIKAKEEQAQYIHIKRRLQVLMLRYKGYSIGEIAEKMNLKEPSIVQLCQRYRKEGLEEFARNRYMCHNRILTREQEAEIMSQFDGRLIKTQEVKAALDEACGKETNDLFVYNVLKRQGWQKCKGQRWTKVK